MINPGKPFNIHDYFEISLRRIWYIIIPFIIIMAGAILYAFNTPKEYRATTLILVTPQKVPEAFVRPTVTSRIEDRLQSIGQEIMSRTRLEIIISQLKLYEGEAKSSSTEEIVELMRKNIRVDIKGKEGYFTISYQGKDPKTVTLVTNKLGSLFIEENLKLREQQAQGTSEFLAIELNATKTKLEEQEKEVTQFKRKFMGELPEQREANLRVLEQLQNHYQRIGESLRAAQDRKLIIQKRLSDFEMMITQPTDGEGLRQEETLSDDSLTLSPPTLSPPLPKTSHTYEAQLHLLKNQLVELQAKYTDKHPDILMTKKKIADLEAKIEKSEGDSPETKKGGPRKKEKVDVKNHPGYKDLESLLTATNMEIERLREDDAKIKAQLSKYRERIENSTVREQDMTLLTRDYENTKEAYQTLLKKTQEAQQAENLERRQKGEQFKVIDPARIPEKPFKPDIPKILLFGLLLGIGCSFGMAFFKEQNDRSFRDAEDLETTLGFKVLANIPKIEDKIEKKAA